jgi:hypothetical protein
MGNVLTLFSFENNEIQPLTNLSKSSITWPLVKDDEWDSIAKIAIKDKDSRLLKFCLDKRINSNYLITYAIECGNYPAARILSDKEDLKELIKGSSNNKLIYFAVTRELEKRFSLKSQSTETNITESLGV